TSTVDDELVLFAEFVDAEDGDDVLQLLVLLQNRLDLVGHTVVLVTDDQRIEDARGRGQRVDGRVQTARSDVAAELCGRGQVGEGRRRGRVRVVIGGNVDRLHRRDRVTTRRGDAFLQQTHLVSQIGLVAHGRGHATQQGRDLGTGRGEAEDVGDEQQHVLVLHIAEVLRHGQRRQGHAQTGAWRFVHLAEDQGGVLEHSCFVHLHDEVVALTGTLAHTGEHRGARVVVRDAEDHHLDE